MSKIIDLVLGTDERMRPRTGLTLLTDGIFMAWLIAGGLVWRMGRLDTPGFLLIVAVITIPRLFFYPLCRSGITLKWADAGLTQLQMIHANAVAVTAYALIPDLRAALMQVLCLVQVFGLFTLRPRAALTMGLTGTAMLLAMLAWSLIASPANFDMRMESVRLPFSAFALTLLALMSRQYALMRAAVREKKLELAQTVEQVNELVTRDALTGLRNRQYMQDMLERERARMARGGTRYCVALIDLDLFKHVNDTHGHHVGDDVLIAFAKTAQEVLRTSDMIARWGGEEFLVLMPDTDPGEQGLIGIERLRTSLARIQVSDTVPELRVSFSAGVAGCTQDEPPEHVLDRADRALYAAKAAGRNCCVLAPPPPAWVKTDTASPASAQEPGRGQAAAQQGILKIS